jgi:hypothetical protein
MNAPTLAKQTRLPSPSLKQAFRRMRLVPSPSAPSVRAVPAAPPAAPVAHPFTHDEQPARCPACELRAYLDG